MAPFIIAAAAAATAAGVSAAVAGTVIAGITISAVGAAAIGALAAIAVSYIGSTLLASISGNKGPGQSSSFAGLSGLRTSARSAAAVHQIIYGRVRKGGTLVFFHSKPKPGSAKNEILYLAIVLAANECDAVEQYYINGTPIVIDSNGDCTSPAKYVGLIKIQTGLGSPDQLANAFFISECEGKWTVEHRLRGRCTAYVKLTYDAAVFGSGIPNVSAVIRGMKVKDFRTGVTAYSENPAVCLWDYMQRRDNIGRPLGIGATESMRDNSYWTVAANICDEYITVPGGVEKRFTCNGVLSIDATPKSKMEELLTSFAGTTSYTAGKWRAFAAGYVTPSIEFSESDIATIDASDAAVTVQTNKSLKEKVNGVKALYIDKEQDYNLVEMPEISVNETELNRRFIDLTMPFTNSVYCSQRVANIALKQSRKQISLSIPLNFKGMKITPGDNVKISLERFGWDKKVFKCMGWQLDDLGQITATFRDDSVDIYSDDIDYKSGATLESATVPNWVAEDATAPDWLVAVGLNNSIQLYWDEVQDPSFSSVNIFMASTNDRATSTLVDKTSTRAYTVNNLPSNETRYFWIRSEDIYGTLSAFEPSSPTGGVSATTQADSSALITVTVNITVASLNVGTAMVLDAAILQQYYIRNIVITGVADFDHSGNKDVILTDGITTWTTLDKAYLKNLSPARWGETHVPYPAAQSDISKESGPGQDIKMQYSGGTTSYLSGTFTVLMTYERKL
jgi:hypothetical protein